MKRIIAYDISDNKIRYRLSKFLEKNGLRIQESVFVADIPSKNINRFMKKIEKINNNNGKIHVFTLCASCQNKAVAINDNHEMVIII